MIKLPKELKDLMDDWRAEGGWRVPDQYNDYHAKLATLDLKTRDWQIVGDCGLVDDG